MAETAHGQYGVWQRSVGDRRPYADHRLFGHYARTIQLRRYIHHAIPQNRAT